MADIGSSWALVELDPVQMNGGTLSRDGGFPNLAPPATSDVTLISVTNETSYQPTWLPEDAAEAEITSPKLLVELLSIVFMRTDAAESDELYIVILSLISQNDVEKL